MLSELAAKKPDVLVFELGDGLMGAYGVQAILRDASVRDAISALVLCANDPVGAWGGVRILREEYGIEPVAITGRATDNRVGVAIAREHLGIPAINAMTHGAELGDLLLAKLGMPQQTPESATVS